MKKKIVFISLIIICLSLILIFAVSAVIRKQKLDYQLETVKEINYMIINENNKFGVINKNGDVLVQPRYDEIQIPNPSKPLFICMYNYDEEKHQYNIKVFNDKSEQILYQYVVVEAIKLNSGISEIPYEKSVLKYMDKGKYGLIDFDGKVISKAQYDEISSFDYNEGLLLVKKNDKYGIINIKGATLIKPKYDKIESDGYYEDGEEYRKSGFIIAKKSGDEYKYGYINRLGKQILDIKYDQIARIPNKNGNNDVYLIAVENGKAGFYKNKKAVIKPEYEDMAYDENNNCLIVQKDLKQGIYDLDGNSIIEMKYDKIYISGKYINAQNDSNIDIYDYSTKQKIDILDIVGMNETSNEKYSIAITNDEKFKIYDNSTKELMDYEYEYLEYLYDDCFITFRNSKFGIIDINNNTIVDFKYDSIQKIPNTKIVQATDFKKETTDIILANNVIQTMNQLEIYTKENYIILQSSSDRKYMDFDGNIVEASKLFERKLYAYKKDDKWGFADKDGQVIIEPQYDFVTEFNEYGFAGIKIDGKWGCININGEIVVEPEYIIDSNNPNFVGKYYEYDLGYGDVYYISK